jgi:hypothetical protein
MIEDDKQNETKTNSEANREEVRPREADQKPAEVEKQPEQPSPTQAELDAQKDPNKVKRDIEAEQPSTGYLTR